MKVGSGNRIRELREAKGISGTKLAEMIGISPQYLYDLERGEKRLNEETIARLTEVLKVSADYLLGLSDQLQLSIWDRDTPPTDMELEELLRSSNPNFFGSPLNDEDIEDILTYMRVKWEREKKKREKGGKN